jgi:hypothetical protein
VQRHSRLACRQAGERTGGARSAVAPVVRELVAQLDRELAFELRRFRARHIQHQDARFLMASGNRDQQFNPIRSTVTGGDADHFEPGIVIGRDGAADRRDGVEGHCQSEVSIVAGCNAIVTTGPGVTRR